MKNTAMNDTVFVLNRRIGLMHERDYRQIGVTDIAEKAGVGRATFYRYFKSKEDVIEFYFMHNTKEFVFEQHYSRDAKPII